MRTSSRGLFLRSRSFGGRTARLEAVSTLALWEGECSAKRALGPHPHSLLTRFARFVFALKETLLGFPQRTFRRALPLPQLTVR
ncbi:MAG: hypothetical protein RLZZ450_7581 [Pseudomonadota bacterium]|jgi:hypothetical protein